MQTNTQRFPGERHPAPQHPRYTIRYCRRRAEELAALLVVDEDATTYLFSDGILQLRFAGEEAERHLQSLLAEHPVWSPFADAHARTLDELRALTQPHR